MVSQMYEWMDGSKFCFYGKSDVWMDGCISVSLR